MSLEAALITAVSALAVAVVFLYFDGKKMAKAFAKATKDLADAFVVVTEKKETAHADVIKTLSSSHQKQEDEITARAEATIKEVNAEHRRELGALVDRILEGARNDKEHDREERRRIVDLAESLERRVPSRGGRGG